MNIKQFHKVSHFLLLAVLVTSILAIVTPSRTFAATADSNAKTFCDGKYTDSKQNAACAFGYVKGYNGSTKGDCFGYANHRLPSSLSDDAVKNSDLYKSCAAGKVQGKVDKKTGVTNPGTTGKQDFKGEKCGDVTTFFDFACGSGTNNKSGGNDNPIFRILLTIIAWLTAGVMVAVIGGIIYGGFLYMTAQDNASQTQKGIKIIVDAVIGLIAFGLMWTFLNFIIPGGIYAG